MKENGVSKSSKIKVIVITALIFIVSIAGVSYAYFTIQITGNDTASSMRLRTANMSLVYNDVQIVSGEYATPGWSDTKALTVTNTGNVTADYIIKFRELVNTIVNGELVLSAECSSSSGTCADLPERAVHAASSEITDAYMYGPITIAPGVTHTYTLTAEFIETGSNQNYNQNKYFNGTLNIGDGTPTPEGLFSYTVSNNEVTITGFKDEFEIVDVDKCISYWNNHNFGTYCGAGGSTFCSANMDYTNCGSPKLREIIRNNIPSSDYETAGIVVNDVSAKPTEMIIPSTIDGKPVVEIRQNAFSYNHITSVIIPEGVTTIGNSAFLDNQLTSAIIPSTVISIGSNAFSNNQLTSIIIPDSVTTLGGSSFSHNNIVSAVIPNNITVIQSSLFYVNQLAYIRIPNGVTDIRFDAFANNNLTSITIPNSVEDIEWDAFYNNQITSVVIPNSVTSIGSGAFETNNISYLYIPNSVTSVAYRAFNDNVLPDDQAYIYKRTDNNNDNVSEIDYTTIVSYGGANKNIVIPNGVTTIEDYAFYSCRLVSVVIPSSVNSLYDSAFDVNQLTSVTIYDKSSKNDFDVYEIVNGHSMWGWASGSGCTDATCITWLGSGS